MSKFLLNVYQQNPAQCLVSKIIVTVKLLLVKEKQYYNIELLQTYIL